MTTIIQLIETFNFDAGPVAGERRKSRLHADSCRNRRSHRSPASHRTRRSRRRPLLVTLERTMDAVRPLWTHCRSRRTGRAHHRGSINLLGPASETSGQKSAKSSLNHVHKSRTAMISLALWNMLLTAKPSCDTTWEEHARHQTASLRGRFSLDEMRVGRFIHGKSDSVDDCCFCEEYQEMPTAIFVKPRASVRKVNAHSPFDQALHAL